MISCILLIAGESKRFITPKAIATLDGKPIIAQLLRKLIKSTLQEIIVVLGANANLIQPHILHHKKIMVVYNKHYILGQTSSFQIGIQNASADTEGFLLLPIDVPFVKTSTINELVAEFIKQRPPVLIPSFNERKGHPPIFHQRLRDEILQLPPQEGMNVIVRRHLKTGGMILPVDDAGIVATFNTPEEFEEIKNRFHPEDESGPLLNAQRFI